jgi:hypothetical protein
MIQRYRTDTGEVLTKDELRQRLTADLDAMDPETRAETAQSDADLASDLIASGVTTQSVDTVVAVLSTHRDGASINATAKAAGINYRSTQRIVEGAKARRQEGLPAAS